MKIRKPGKLAYSHLKWKDHDFPSNWAAEKILSVIKSRKIIFVRDPDRIITSESNSILSNKASLSIHIVKGNLEFRRVLQRPCYSVSVIVDQSPLGCFAPDFQLNEDCKILEISIIDFLKEKTGITYWPEIIREYPYREICKDIGQNFLKVLNQRISRGEINFTNKTLRRIAAEAVLGFSFILEPKLEEALKIALSGKEVWAKLISYFGVQETKELQLYSKSFPHPINTLLDPNLSSQAVIALGGLAILAQHYENCGEMLALIDPQFYDYTAFKGSDLPESFEKLSPFQEATRKFDQSINMIQWEKISDKLDISNPVAACEVLLTERLSPRIGTLCLLSIIANFLEGEKLYEKVSNYKTVYEKLTEPTDILENDHVYQRLRLLFRRSYECYKMLSRLYELTQSLKLKKDTEHNWDSIILPWVNEKLCLTEYYVGSLSKDWNQVSFPDILPKWAKQISANIGPRLETLAEFSSNLITELNMSFQKLVRNRYSADAGNLIPTTAEFLKDFLKPIIKQRKTPRPSVVLLFDGMRCDIWETLFSPIFKDRFEYQKLIYGLSRLPSNTPFSRRAAFSGLRPIDFKLNAPESALLQEAIERLEIGKGKVEEVENLKSISKAIKIAIRIPKPEFYFIVLNLSDNLSHHIDYSLTELFNMMSALSDTINALLNNLPVNSDIFVLSDHGFTKLGRKTVAVKEGEVYYRYAFLKNDPSENILQRALKFNSSDLGLPGNDVVLFPQVGCTFVRSNEDSVNDFYYHGGISLEELIIPFVHLTPRARRAPHVTITLELDPSYGAATKGYIIINLTLEEQSEAEVEVTSSLTNFSNRIVLLKEKESRDLLVEFIPETTGVIHFAITVTEKGKILGSTSALLSVKTPTKVEREEIEGLKELFGDSK